MMLGFEPRLPMVDCATNDTTGVLPLHHIINEYSYHFACSSVAGRSHLHTLRLIVFPWHISLSIRLHLLRI